MLFKGIGKTFSTENDRQFETIGVFWDEFAAKYGRENLQGLGYGWTNRSIEYVIGLIDGLIDGADRTVELPDLGKIYEKIYQESRLKYEIERFTDNGDCEITYYRSIVLDKRGGLKGKFTANMIAPCGLDCSICTRLPRPVPVPDAAAQMTTNRNSIRRDAASFCVKREGQTGIRSVMSARIFPALTSWKRKPGTGRSTRSANPPLENLRTIRGVGMPAFLERERKKWTCPACGGVICVHTGVCSGGRQYADSMNH